MKTKQNQLIEESKVEVSPEALPSAKGEDFSGKRSPKSENIPKGYSRAQQEKSKIIEMTKLAGRKIFDEQKISCFYPSKY